MTTQSAIPQHCTCGGQILRHRDGDIRCQRCGRVWGKTAPTSLPAQTHPDTTPTQSELTQIADRLMLEPEMGDDWNSLQTILQRIGEWDQDRELAWGELRVLRAQRDAGVPESFTGASPSTRFPPAQYPAGIIMEDAMTRCPSCGSPIDRGDITCSFCFEEFGECQPDGEPVRPQPEGMIELSPEMKQALVRRDEMDDGVKK